MVRKGRKGVVFGRIYIRLMIFLNVREIQLVRLNELKKPR